MMAARDGDGAQIDVDAVLRQLKQAKDRELRLRAEKERVRKELDALRTGDLWTRETAAQRQLEAIRARRHSLHTKESAEREQLEALDQELRDKEASIHRHRRSPHDAIKQAAASIVTPASADQSSNPSSSSSSSASPNSVGGDERSAPSMAIVSQTPKPRRVDTSVPVRRAPGNQDTANDAMAQLAFSIDLEKQQTRVKRLEQQLEKSKALQDSGRNAWDLPLPTVRRKDPAIARREQNVEDTSPSVSVEPSHEDARNEAADPAMDTLQPNARAPLTQAGTKDGSQSTQLPLDPRGMVHPSYAWSYQPHTVPNQATGEPRVAYHQAAYPVGAASAPTPMCFAGYTPPSMIGPVFSMLGPPAALPVMIPSAYSPWGLSPPFGLPSYGYGPPLFAQPPPPLAHAGPFLPQVSLPFVAPPVVDEEVMRLQRELEGLRKKDQENDDEQEFTKVQELLAGLQNQVTQLTRTKSGDIPSDVAGDTPRTSAIAETKDASLTSIKRQHLEAVLKVRNERDLLEEQDKLEEVQERVEKRREERRRDMNHEALVTKQKQELMALRLQRAVAKMDPKRSGRGILIPDAEASNRSYDPDEGVLLCWDFASGLLASLEIAQLTFAVYDGKIPRSPIKALTSKECESEGPSHKRAIFAANRLLKPLPASENVVVVVEVSSVSSSESGKPTLRRLGWAAVDLFRRARSTSSSDCQLASGWVKIKLSPTAMPDPTTVLVRGSTSTEPTSLKSGDVVLYFRIANGELEEQARNVVVEPDLHAGRYQEPTSSHRIETTTQPAGTHNASASHNLAQLPSSASNVNPVVKDAVVGAAPLAKLPEQKRTFDQPPPSRDYLDVERLRLLSSSSATLRPSSELVRPRSTLSAIPRHRVGGSSLPVVPEASHFDDTSSTSPWIRVDKSGERNRRFARQLFQPGDAFDVYIDGGRFLPDNVAVTKVTIAALNSDRSKVFPSIPDANSLVAAATGDASSPSYNLYVEYREKVFDPTLTLVIRVDTIDIRSKSPVILGYAVLAVFLDADSHTQPTKPNDMQFGLNEGAFQLPLYVNASVNDVASGPLSAASAVASIPRLPCATLLLRLKAAVMSEDGLQVLSRRTVQPHEWVALGLDEPAPPYEAGSYDSTASIPTPQEMKMYHLRDQDKKKRFMSVQQTLTLLGLSSIPIGTLFPAKPSSFMDLRFAYRYQPAIGFRISIDGLFNVKVKAGGFCRVVYSVYPPGSFYQSIRLTSGVRFTTTTDWSSLPTSPEFQDGFAPLRDIPADPRLVVVIDVRAVTKNPKTNAYQSQPLAWTFLPVLDDRTGSVAAGSFQIPLFVGEVKLAALDSSTGLPSLMEDIAAEKKKLLLPFMDGASVFVRIEDPQVPTTTPSQPLIGATISSMMPAKALARYQYDAAKVAVAKKKTPLNKLLPPGTTEKHMDAEINQAFAAEMGIHHY